ncbi:TetR family transcriptional regulator [Sanguibacter antarcticus]|uniref:TetR family transcriptional regulator n=1 Tax=Sanguibacter antarcticus TaxID=372484 RepID=A0A2A9E8H2_9MICO|nr:TetR family transcriptional regulator [Sanguibacter antarcticus]PFG34532.1 TetR family transcriptional regulator [Sanguibacter antarcticus]
MTTPGPRRNRPTGRRAGDSGTREAILDAALSLFAEHGYESASIRAIASTAGVDPALIRHFFGDKEALFAAAVADRTTIPTRIAAAMSGDPTTAGREIADVYLRLWEEADTRKVLLALFRSAVTSANAADILRDVFLARILENAAHDAEEMRRFTLAGSHLLGVALARHLVRIPPLADLTLDELVDEVAPTIQRYLTDTHR